MLNTARLILEFFGFAKIDLFMKSGWRAIQGFDKQIDGNAYFYRGERNKFLAILASLGRYSHAFFVGADVVDGVYNPLSVRRRLSVLAEIASLGGETTVLGCSFSETPDQGCIAALAALPPSVHIKARDPVSKKRMEAVLDRSIELVADLAFLQPAHPSQAAATLVWIESRRKAGDRVVAINANYIIDAKYVGFSAALETLMNRLLADDISLLLVPHDLRTDRSDQVILQEARARLPDYADRIRLLDPEEPGLVKAVLASVDFVVTSRMHVAILAMGSGRPTLSFGYQGKFEGLYQMLGLSGLDLLFSPSALLDDPNRVHDVLLHQLQNVGELSRRLAETLPAVRELAFANFSTLKPGAEYAAKNFNATRFLERVSEYDLVDNSIC
jgi:polysaccharide pyruvyl transferase WcaK-like protein